MTESTSLLEPVFDKDAVAIMLATDDNYAPYASVMIQSIKENANKARNYDIVVVGNLSDHIQKMLTGMAEQNISIRVIDISPLLKDIDLSVFSINRRFTIETYYRFFIPKLFHQYEKVLYLDVDMVVFRDVAELFDTDIGENWWVVVRSLDVAMAEQLHYERGTHYAWGTHHAWGKSFLPYLKTTLKMDSAFDHFQAGVMVWNIKQCINDKVFEQLIDRLKIIGTPKYVDQDVMNSLANGKHIHWLHGKWNALWCIWFWATGKETLAYKEVKSHLNDPYIIHFCGGVKPWNEPHRPHADKFWQYARKSPFYEIILYKAFDQKVAGTAGTIQGIRKELNAMTIKKYKRKVMQYKILQTLTFGLVKSFSRRKSYYRNKIKQLKG